VAYCLYRCDELNDEGIEEFEKNLKTTDSLKRIELEFGE